MIFTKKKNTSNIHGVVKVSRAESFAKIAGMSGTSVPTGIKVNAKASGKETAAMKVGINAKSFNQ